MKTNELPPNYSNFNQMMNEKKFIPNSTEKTDISVDNQTISFRLNMNCENIQEAYLVAFDKKNVIINAVQSMEATTNNLLSCHLSEDFIASINSTKDFKYARLCIALIYNECYSFFYLSHPEQKVFDDNNCYAGTLHINSTADEELQLIAYYSQAGLLSIKYISSTDCYNKYYNCTIEDISFTDNKLKLQLSCISLSGTTGYPVLMSRTSNSIVKEISAQIESRVVTSTMHETIECSFDFDLLRKDDSYSVSYLFGSNILKLSLSDSIDPLHNPLFKDIYKSTSDQIYNVALSVNDNNELTINIGEHIYPYMFSIIMAVYNTELFLSEALDSILIQETAPLQRFIVGSSGTNYKKQIYRNVYEVIMIDDGSTDASGQICDAYAETYEHFKVIHKENGGVSTARNAGIKIAQGKYLNFMDSDDMFSNNVLNECFYFFEDNYDKTDMITFPIKFFDASTGDHWLNGKFDNSNRIINLMNEYDKCIMFVNASVFKAEKIKGAIEFESSLTTGEDIRFIYSLFFKEGARFGILNKCTYWYRRRSVGEASAIQASKTSRNFYFEYLTSCLDWLLHKSQEHFGFIPYFVQYLVAQQLQWRFKEDPDASIAKTVISENELLEYRDHIQQELQLIDANIILEQKKIFKEQKKYILELKTGKPLHKFYDGNDITYFYESQKLSTASSNYVRLEFMKIKNNCLYLEGYSMSFEKTSELYLKINNEYILLTRDKRDMNVYALGEPIFFATSFNYTIKLNDNIASYRIELYEKIDGYFVPKKDIRYAKTMPLSEKFNKSYFIENNWAIRRDGSSFQLTNLYDIDIKHFKKFENDFIEQAAKKISNNGEKNALAFRKELIPMLYHHHRFKRKQIWLISDRVNMAGDNGEAFYLYMLKKNNPEIDLYFVINKDCPDFERMNSLGKVVIQNSKEHKILHFMADYIISSQANEYVINPFFHDNTTDIFRDLLYKPKFVFLQHGIIKDDLSNWLNRYKKDMTGFITAAIPEYQSLLDYNYYYTAKEVWLTGLARHDRLYNDEKNYITIMPTWRKYLSTASLDDPEVTVVKDNFRESNFFKFYNSLINDQRLLNAAETNGYTICFMPHPNIMNNLSMFTQDPRVNFFGTEKPYREIFAESNLVMTDYSSSVMDFAYLRKPLVYCHFDREEFFAGDHVYVKGYFDYEQDGFGEVTYDLDSLVNILIDYMNTGCELKTVYKDRMDNFFAFNDKNNCERLYNRLMEDE